MSPYLPLSAYGAIGDLRTVALVSNDGSIDWCCFPYLSGPSVFGSLLDHGRGGRFRVALTDGQPLGHRYVPDTNVLQTRWRSARGALLVTDFMPLTGRLDGERPADSPHEIHRVLCCEAGEVEVFVDWTPRFDYGRATTTVEPVPGGFIASSGALQLGLGGLAPERCAVADDGGPTVRTRFRLHAGETRVLVTRWGTGAPRVSLDDSLDQLRGTVDAWRGWLYKEGRIDRGWAGSLQPLIKRSELILKLLTYAESGAIAAAATTSLPETLGGVRNWDYRFSWVRDAGLTAQALNAVGHRDEAKRFLQWVEAAAWTGERSGRSLQIMYGLHGEPDLPEEELPHLEGYMGSSPVRIGNEAAEQRQHDIYGELLTAAYELVRQGEPLTRPIADFLMWITEEACTKWTEPDSGIWEVRGESRHYTHSKVLSWAALDRALRMVDAGVLPPHRRERWLRHCGRLREVLLREAYDPEIGSFVQSFGSTALDASSLLIPIHELLPAEDPRVQSTIDRTLEQLTDNGLVYRYVVDDGLPGREGAFGLTTFWLVDALVLSGRQEEAWSIFEGMAQRASPLGLYSEQIDPRSGAFLGNYPQAFSHLGLINSALYLAHGEGRALPVSPLLGTEAHRRGAPSAMGGRRAVATRGL